MRRERIFASLALLLAPLCAGLAAVAGSADAARPAVDKTALRNKIFVHCNPWFPIDVVGRHTCGGPNVPWEHYEGTNGWRRCMEVLQRYGVDGIKLEINEPTGPTTVYRNMLNEAPEGFTIAMHFGFYSREAAKSIANVKTILGPYRTDFASNPRVLRLGGRPVLFVYCLMAHGPEFYREVFAGIEREFGPMVFLLCYSDLWLRSDWTEEGFEKQLRAYLPVFDGVSTYAFSYEDVAIQRAEARVLGRVMKEPAFAGKVFEGGAFTTWTQPFVQSGLEVHLTRDWRESVDLWTDRALGADAIELTNLFDHYEQSLVYPCYEREDFVLRYLQYAAAKWRGSPFPREKEPELVLANYVTAQLGWTPLDFEVVGFPIDSDETRVSVSVELCNASGKVLRVLGPKALDLKAFDAATFSVPSVAFAAERAIVPRLAYTWRGETRRLPYNPMTLLSPSARNYRMYWARSTKNAYELYRHPGDSEDWTLDGVRAGGTRRPTADGQGVFVSHVRHHQFQNANPRRGFQRAGIRRDGEEFWFTKEERHNGLVGSFALQFPPAGKALHWYQLELQNRHGRRWQSLPVWESDGSRDRLVTMPILDGTNGVVRCPIEDVRVPFYHWPCDRDGGRLMLDASGYVHNAIRNPRQDGYDIAYIGYNLYCNSPFYISPKHASVFRIDEDGRGAYEFGGKDCFVSFGGTGFPGASTYELWVKPAAIGSRMGLLNTDGGHVLLSVLPDGRVRAARRAAPKPGADQFAYEWPEIVSKAALPVGVWTHLAFVYDLGRIRLYVNGNPEGEAAAAPCYTDRSFGSKANPNCSHECRNALMIGAEVADERNTPRNNFIGRIRDVRAYGRNLSPDEFLRRFQN